MGATDGWLNLWQRGDDGGPSVCGPIQVHNLLHPLFEPFGEGWGWTHSENPQSDIAALPLIGPPETDIANTYYFDSLNDSMILPFDQAGLLPLGTETIMIGYPGGQPEPGTQYPQFLYGLTVERPAEQGGRPTDAVHIPTTQGSSGSPILVNKTGEPLQAATWDSIAVLGVVHAIDDEFAIYVRAQEILMLKQHLSEWLEDFEW